MFFCNGPVLQNILRGNRNGHATVKETFLCSRIYDLLEREREKKILLSLVLGREVFAARSPF